MVLGEPLSILLINQPWLLEELRELGHRVVSVGWLDKKAFDVKLSRPGMSIEEVLRELPRGFHPDRIVYYDDSGPVGIIGLDMIDIPSVFYSVDAHHHSNWHRFLALGFDIVLVAQKDYLSTFSELHSDVRWFPLWASKHIEPAAEKTIDVCFRGNLDPHLHPKRADFFSRLQRHVEIDARVGPYEEAYPSAKIVVNQAVRDDLNFRVYEAMMCGALLVTPRVPNGLDELFREGEHYVSYEDDNADDAAAKILDMLADDGRRRGIAEAARSHVLASHTNSARARELEDILRSCSVTERPLRHLGIAQALFCAARICARTSEVLARRMIIGAAHSISSSAVRRENQSHMFFSALFGIKYQLEEYGFLDIAIDVLEKVRESFPEHTLGHLGQIDTLMRAGREEEARSLAAAVSPDPEQLIAQLPVVLGEVRVKLAPIEAGAPAQ